MWTSLAVAVFLGAQVPEAAVPDTSELTDAFLDATARELVLGARRARDEFDDSLLSYTAVVRERIAAGIRTFRKDRTIYRREAASRVRWSRDEDIVVQMLAAREEHPGGAGPDAGLSGPTVDEVYDPIQDPIYFGMLSSDDEDVWTEHPLERGSERHYRYETGDTLTLSLPDGRRLRAIEVRVLPREPSIHLLSGSLWLDAEAAGPGARRLSPVTNDRHRARPSTVRGGGRRSGSR